MDGTGGGTKRVVEAAVSHIEVRVRVLGVSGSKSNIRSSRRQDGCGECTLKSTDSFISPCPSIRVFIITFRPT